MDAVETCLDNLDFLEPHCLSCKSRIDFSMTTTEWDAALNILKCKNCGSQVEEPDPTPEKVEHNRLATKK